MQLFKIGLKEDIWILSKPFRHNRSTITQLCLWIINKIPELKKTASDVKEKDHKSG